MSTPGKQRLLNKCLKMDFETAHSIIRMNHGESGSTRHNTLVTKINVIHTELCWYHTGIHDT